MAEVIIVGIIINYTNIKKINKNKIKIINLKN